MLIDALAAPGDRGWALIIGVGVLVGWWASTQTARRSGIADPSFVVVDEVVAFWLVLWMAAPTCLWGQAVRDSPAPNPMATRCDRRAHMKRALATGQGSGAGTSTTSTRSGFTGTTLRIRPRARNAR